MLCLHKANNVHKDPSCVCIELKIFINIQKLKIFFQVLRWHGLTVLASLFSCQWQRPHHSRRSGVLLFILSSSFHYLIILLFHHLIIASLYHNLAPLSNHFLSLTIAMASSFPHIFMISASH